MRENERERERLLTKMQFKTSECNYASVVRLGEYTGLRRSQVNIRCRSLRVHNSGRFLKAVVV